MGIGRAVAVVLSVTMLIMTGACDSDGEVDPGADPSEPSTPSASALSDSETCLAAQVRMVWIVQRPLQSLTQRVLSQPDQAHLKAAELLRQGIARTARSSQKACGGDPTALIPLTELVRSAIDEGLDEPVLRRIVEAYEEWRRTVGKPFPHDDPARRDHELAIIRYANLCAPMRKHVHASYEILRRAESGGVAVWVEIELTNEFSEPWSVGHHGRLRATGVRPEGGTWDYGWGGSSADWAMAAAGQTSRTAVDPFPSDPVDPAAPRKPEPILLHLFPGGDVEVLEFEAWSWSERTGSCRIRVEPAQSR